MGFLDLLMGRRPGKQQASYQMAVERAQGLRSAVGGRSGQPSEQRPAPGDPPRSTVGGRGGPAPAPSQRAPDHSVVGGRGGAAPPERFQSLRDQLWSFPAYSAMSGTAPWYALTRQAAVKSVIPLVGLSFPSLRTLRAHGSDSSINRCPAIRTGFPPTTRISPPSSATCSSSTRRDSPRRPTVPCSTNMPLWAGSTRPATKARRSKIAHIPAPLPRDRSGKRGGPMRTRASSRTKSVRRGEGWTKR